MQSYFYLNSAKRQELYNTFCRSSNPGMKLKPEYDRFLKNISLPHAVLDDVKQQIVRIYNNLNSYRK